MSSETGWAAVHDVAPRPRAAAPATGLSATVADTVLQHVQLTTCGYTTDPPLLCALMVFPFVLGDGEGLFGETSEMKPLRLVDARTVGDSLAFLTYQPVRNA